MRIAQWIAEKRRPVSVSQLSELVPERNYTGLNIQDQELRLWVSEPVKRGLEEVSKRANLSMTAYLIEFFAIYLYGYHEVLRMREMNTGLYEPRRMQLNEEGLGDELEPNLGKNIFPLKSFVPLKLKSDLSKLAAKDDLTLGEFARALIIAHLFGQTYAPRRKASSKNNFEARANKWEAESLPAGDIPWK
jgi:hypothetical protein